MSVLGTKRKYSIPSANFHSCIAGSMDRCNICNYTPSQKIRDFCSRAIVKRPIVSLNGLKIVCRMDWLCSRKQTIIAVDCAPPIPLSGGIQQELMRHTCKVRIFSNIESLKCLVSDIFAEIDDKWVAAKKGYIKWELQDEWSGQIEIYSCQVSWTASSTRASTFDIFDMTAVGLPTGVVISRLYI